MFVQRRVFDTCVKHLTPRINHGQSSIIRVHFFFVLLFPHFIVLFRQQFKHKVFAKKGKLSIEIHIFPINE